MNQNYTTHHNYRASSRFSHIIILLMLPWFISTCDSVVGTITYEQPIPPDGIREWIISVTDQQDNPLSGFTLTVSAPDTTQVTVQVAGADYKFEDLITGIYIVQVEKDGYFGNTTQMPIQIPLDRKENYFATTRVKLQIFSPPVIVDNAQGGTATAPGVTDDGARSEESSVTIPPGAIPGSGDTEVSFTRVAPRIIATTEDLLLKPADPSTLPAELKNGLSAEMLSYYREIPLDIFYLKAGSQEVTFNSPVEMTFPLNPPKTGQFGNISYVLKRMEGNVDNGLLTQTKDTFTIPFDSEGTGKVNVQKSGIYQIFAVVILETVFARSTRFVIGSTECGRGANFTITSPAPPTVGPYFSFLLVLPPRTTATTTFQVPPVRGARSTLFGYYNYVEYKVSLVLAGAALELYRFPLTQVSVEQQITNCHNSGGS